MSNSVGNLASWLRPPLIRLKRASSFRTAESDFPRTDVSAAPIWGFAWEISSCWIRNSFAGREQATLIGLTNLRTSGPPPMSPKLNQRRALFVLEKIDEILHWERTTEQERDTRFVELGRYLCEVRAGQYWRVDNLKSFDEFLEKKFPESRRKAYYLMAIHEQLPRQTHRDLKEMGWTKARELVRVARAERQNFDCAPWVHKAKQMPREEFKREVERHLTGKETEPWEMLYFKVYKSQLAVIEQALEIASLMLGGQKARGYCLEMICADFLAGANLETSGSADSLLFALSRTYLLLPNSQQQEFLLRISKGS